MPLPTRRQFVRTVGAGLLAAPLWADEKVRAFLNGATPKKVIVVAGRLVNIVT